MARAWGRLKLRIQGGTERCWHRCTTGHGPAASHSKPSAGLSACAVPEEHPVIRNLTRRVGWPTQLTLTALASAAACLPAQARVTRIVIDNTTATAGLAGYETLRGRAFGEISAPDAHNAVINDLTLGVDGSGKLLYETTFTPVKLIDMGSASGLMWHDVPYRGSRGEHAPGPARWCA